MQGVVFDIKRFEVHDGPGIRTTVFFKGCNMRCLWCHNPESIDRQPFSSVKKVTIENMTFDHVEVVGKMYTVSELMQVILRDRVFMEESGGGVTFSGGEPTMQPDFLFEMLKACKHEGLRTAVDTNGMVKREVLEQLIPYTDLFLYDIKHYDAEKHRKGTEVPNELIIENLTFLIERQCKVRIRIPVIPDFNYTDQDLKSLVTLLKPMQGSIIQVDLLPYHNIATNKYKRFGIYNQMHGTQALTKADMKSAKILFEAEGFRVKVGG